MGRFVKGSLVAHALAALALSGAVAVDAVAEDRIGWGPGDPAAKTRLVVELVEDGQSSDVAYGGASRKHPWELVLRRNSPEGAADPVEGAREVRVWARSLNAPGQETGIVSLVVDLTDAGDPADGSSDAGWGAHSRREITHILKLKPGVPQLVPLDEGTPAGVPARALRVEIPVGKALGGDKAAGPDVAGRC